MKLTCPFSQTSWSSSDSLPQPLAEAAEPDLVTAFTGKLTSETTLAQPQKKQCLRSLAEASSSISHQGGSRDLVRTPSPPLSQPLAK